MSTWKQETADAVIPIEGINNVSATITWRIITESDIFSVDAKGKDDSVSASVSMRAPRTIDRRIIDGKNFLAGDCAAIISWTGYLAAFSSFLNSHFFSFAAG